MKNNLVALSIFCLAICFVIGSWIISNGLSNESIFPIKQTVQHQLLTQAELINYLGLSKEEIQKLTERPDGNGNYVSDIPHVKIGKKVYYPKTAIDKWLLSAETSI